MNILWLSHFIPYPPRGGLLQRSYNLLREAAREHDISLLALRQRALHPTAESVDEAVAHLAGLCRRVEVVDIPWEGWRGGWHALVLYSLASPLPYDANWLRSARLARLVEEWLAAESIDLIHCDTVGLAGYVAGVPGIPKILNHHNVESDMMFKRAAGERHPLKRLYFAREGRKLAAWERRWCGQFDHNITVSQLDAQRLSRGLSPGTVSDIPNGCDLDYFRPLGRPLRRQHLVFAGSLGWYPNVRAMEFFCDELWPALKREVPQATMLMVGRRPVASLIERCRHLEGVSLQGYVDDIRPYIDEAHVYVCPIRDSGGTKLKVLDALAMQKAIVAHPIACEGIEVTPERDILLAESPQEFVRQVVRLLYDDALRESLGRAGRQLVQTKYSYALIGRRLRELYASVGGRGRQPAKAGSGGITG
jgi:sugar transferase (PEP-CTERM/EpsH1 system associated)